MSRWRELEAAIARARGQAFRTDTVDPVGGGCIHEAMVIADASSRYFVKRNEPGYRAMFEAEARALDELRRAERVRVPQVVYCGACDSRAVLVLEYIDMHPLTDHAAPILGASLAAMHAIGSDAFGWHIDNFIGLTPQANQRDDDWSGFFRERRLRPQLAMAVRAGYGRELERRGDALMEALDALLAGHQPAPSLLHGDLWGGNAASDGSGAPVLFDPATYFGDRETDLAMTELFGGFTRAFHDAYQDAWPLPAGYPVRRTLYNLYHVLNHLNLFGGAYLHAARRDIDRLLCEVRG